MRAATADGRHVDLARVGLGIGDEFGNRLGRKRRVHHHDDRQTHDTRDGRDVANEIETELVI
jgi:hypothetical protein